MDKNAVFTSNDWGKNEGIALSEGMSHGGEVWVNSPPNSNPANLVTDLSRHIVGPSGARVGKIILKEQKPPFPPLYPYQWILRITAAGPKGAGSGWLNLEFEDSARDTYGIGIFSSEYKEHVLGYDSPNHKIIKIKWYHRAG